MEFKKRVSSKHAISGSFLGVEDKGSGMISLHTWHSVCGGGEGEVCGGEGASLKVSQDRGNQSP